MEIAISTIRKFQIKVDYSHLDSTSFHLHGQYEEASENQESAQPTTIKICHGYSRDHRPDLKQFVLNLISSSDGEIPIFMSSADGNQSDKTEFAPLAKEYHKQMKSALNQETIMISDSALFTQENLQILGKISWITRVPSTIKKAKEMMELVEMSEENQRGIKVLEAEEEETIKQLIKKGYKWQSYQSNYGGITQRWLLVESQARKKSDLKKIDQKIPLEEKEVMKIAKKINRKEWCEIKEYKKEINQLNKKLKYHQIELSEMIEIKKKEKRRYKVKVKISKKESEIERKKRAAGRFILATNIMEEKRLKSGEILWNYKEQQNVERGFRFLKNTIIFCRELLCK